MLTGSEIKKQLNNNIIIEPFNEKQLNPNSYDLRLDKELLIYTGQILDVKKDNDTSKIIIPPHGFILKPNTLYLGSTFEHTKTKNYIPILEGKSSLARLGISIHVTAGFGDIGYDGKWTLEITAVKPVVIYPLMRICQICYFKPEGEIKDIYNGKYQEAKEVISSKSWQDFYK